MTFDEIFEAYYNLYRLEADTPASTDDEYTIAKRLANEAVRRWENYDGTYWNELYATLTDAEDGDKTIATATTSYVAPTDFKQAGGFVKVLSSTGTTQQTYPIIEPNEVQFKDDNATYCYFLGSPKEGYTLHLNPTPSTALVGLTIDYIYYKQATLFINASDVAEMTQPYFIVNRMLANRFRGSRNPYYGSAKTDAEDALRTMQLQNNAGTWANPWEIKDNSGAVFGASNLSPQEFLMPLIEEANLPTKFPNENTLPLTSWRKGVYTLINKSKLPKDALDKARNIFLVEDGQPKVRPGIGWFGLAPSAYEIDGFDYYDANGVIHLVIAAGGIIYRTLDDGNTWSTCTAATYTAGTPVGMNQNGGYLYITTELDNIIRYDGSTTLISYTALTTPAAPTGVVSAALVGATYNVYYKIAAVNEVGFSIASATLSKTTLQPRDAWDATTNYLTLTLPAPQATQTRADIYYSEDNVNFYYLDSIVSSAAAPGVTYKDDGSAIVIPSTTAPTANTTQGPKIPELVNVGDARMFGVRDPNNRNRIWFTSGTFSGAFSTAYDGGYLDWQPGGKYIPMKVEDYRDGKGTPLATIWCDSADGQGCILQMSLDTATVADISVTIPSAYKLPGSRGTPSPGSVVNVLNDYFFYNSQAFYNLGSRAQILNLLSTDEASANIRPTIKQIRSTAEDGIASTYYDAKIYFSVPYNSDTNNYTAIYDTELKAWLPEAFTVGFKKFLRYTDSGGTRRLLAVKPGDSRLSEISYDLKGDYGDTIHTLLQTGLYPTTKNRFGFMFVEEAEVEFSEPNDAIQIDLLGIGRDDVLRVRGTRTLNETTADAGWSTFLWSGTPWSDTSSLPTITSDATVKRYFPVQKEINAYQFRLITAGIDPTYILRTLQIHGTDTEAGKPSRWRLTQGLLWYT